MSVAQLHIALDVTVFRVRRFLGLQSCPPPLARSRHNVRKCKSLLAAAACCETAGASCLPFPTETPLLPPSGHPLPRDSEGAPMCQPAPPPKSIAPTSTVHPTPANRLQPSSPSPFPFRASPPGPPPALLGCAVYSSNACPFDVGRNACIAARFGTAPTGSFSSEAPNSICAVHC